MLQVSRAFRRERSLLVTLVAYLVILFPVGFDIFYFLWALITFKTTDTSCDVEIFVKNILKT